MKEVIALTRSVVIFRSVVLKWCRDSFVLLKTVEISKEVLFMWETHTHTIYYILNENQGNFKTQDTRAHTPSASRVVMSSHVGQPLENPTMHT